MNKMEYINLILAQNSNYFIKFIDYKTNLIKNQKSLYTIHKIEKLGKYYDNLLIPLWVDIAKYRFVLSINWHDIICSTRGILCEYTNKKFNKSIIIKIQRNNQNSLKEIDIINNLQNNNSTIHIYTKYDYTKDYIYLISEKYTGDLVHLIKNNNLSINNKLNIVKQIISSCIYLNKMGYCYVDMKPENILYNFNNDIINIVLADIGSITRINANNDIVESTYPLPFYHSNGLSPKKYDLLTCIWGILILFIRLYTNDEEKNRPTWKSDIYSVYPYIQNALNNMDQINNLKNIFNFITPDNIIDGTYINTMPQTLENLLIIFNNFSLMHVVRI
jgi:serine/threonine protein kinase